MRRFQFWLLVIGSTLVSLLMIKQIFLSRALNHEQRTLIECQETAGSAQTYQTAWQKLAMAIFESSRQDPEFAAVLKSANVEIHTKPNSLPAGSAPIDSTPSSLLTSPKPPGTP
jgi:hypothetical protein